MPRDRGGVGDDGEGVSLGGVGDGWEGGREKRNEGRKKKKK